LLIVLGLIISCTDKKYEISKDGAIIKQIPAVLMYDEARRFKIVNFELNGMKYSFSVIEGNGDNRTINITGSYLEDETLDLPERYSVNMSTTYNDEYILTYALSRGNGVRVRYNKLDGSIETRESVSGIFEFDYIIDEDGRKVFLPPEF
jgi:hypothetical protein